MPTARGQRCRGESRVVWEKVERFIAYLLTLVSQGLIQFFFQREVVDMLVRPSKVSRRQEGGGGGVKPGVAERTK